MEIEQIKKMIYNPSQLDIERYSYGFSLFQANVNKFYPSFNGNFENFYKKLIFNQHLVSIDQNNFNNLTKLIIHNENIENIQPNKQKPVIFATFHFGSYRMINSYLLKKGYKIVLIIDEFSYKTQKNKIIEAYNKLKKLTKQESDFIILNVKNTSSIFKLKKLLSENYSLIIYLDGNTGLLKNKDLNKGHLKISFLNDEIFVKTGFALLSYFLKIPIIPVISYWDNEDKIHLNFHKKLSLNYEIRNKFIKETTIKLYSILSNYIKKYPSQWEPWSYIHEWFPRNKIYPYEKIKNLQYNFNHTRYSVFTINHQFYLFDKFSYRAYVIDKELFFLLKNNNINNNLKKIDKLILMNVVI